MLSTPPCTPPLSPVLVVRGRCRRARDEVSVLFAGLRVYIVVQLLLHVLPSPPLAGAVRARARAPFACSTTPAALERSSFTTLSC